MTLLVTGAAGFVGREVVHLLVQQGGYSAVRLTHRTAPPIPHGSGFEAIPIDLAATGELDSLLEGVDAILHLAAIPGGGTEQNPALARCVNVDAPLAMLEHLDRATHSCRFVYASSIAVFGTPAADVDDGTHPAPTTLYGAHKQMIESALFQFTRRGRVRGISLRLPGIVARPAAPSGLASAFMSDLFHAARDQRPIVLPTSVEATIWLLSARKAAWNLVHALGCEINDGRSLTCPALRVSIGELVGRLFSDRSLVHHAPDPDIERLFGSLPPLATPAALSAGFRADESLDALIASVMAAISPP